MVNNLPKFNIPKLKNYETAENGLTAEFVPNSISIWCYYPYPGLHISEPGYLSTYLLSKYS